MMFWVRVLVEKIITNRIMSVQKSKVVSKLNTVKSFSYELEGTTLSFSLNVEEEPLRRFRKLMLLALEEVEKTILELINK